MSTKKEKELFGPEQSKPSTHQEEPVFSNAELQQMLNDKTTELLQVQTELKSLTLRSLKLHEENTMIKSSESINQQLAQFEFEMKLAERFVKSGAFNCKNAEEAYVKIKSGGEMGLKPVESMQSLCIINGQIDFFGDGRSSRIIKAGFRIEYLDETKDQVTVRVHNTHMKGFLQDHEIIDVREIAKADDQILKRSKAMVFARKNKLRWHGLGMIASFHLAHLFTSVADHFTSDFIAYDQQQFKQLDSGANDFNKERDRILAHIKKAEENLDMNLLEQVQGNRVTHEVVQEYGDAFHHITSQLKSATNEKDKK